MNTTPSPIVEDRVFELLIKRGRLHLRISKSMWICMRVGVRLACGETYHAISACHHILHGNMIIVYWFLMAVIAPTSRYQWHKHQRNIVCVEYDDQIRGHYRCRCCRYTRPVKLSYVHWIWCDRNWYISYRRRNSSSFRRWAILRDNPSLWAKGECRRDMVRLP